MSDQTEEEQLFKVARAVVSLEGWLHQVKLVLHGHGFTGNKAVVALDEKNAKKLVDDLQRMRVRLFWRHDIHHLTSLSRGFPGWTSTGGVSFA